MRKALRYLFITIGILIVAAGCFAAFVAFRGIPSYKVEKTGFATASTPERIEKGYKLASMLCAGCHMDPKTGKLTGKFMDDAADFGKIYSKNITKDSVYGIGKWTDAEIAYLLRTGIKPDGTFLPIMAKLSRISDEDLHSLVAYLRSDHPWVAPDKTVQPQTSYSFLAKFLTNAGIIKPSDFPQQAVPEPDTANLAGWGRYIALDQLECYSCHSQDFAKNDYDHPEKSAGFFGGGNKFSRPDGPVIYSSNITMDKETGIGHWSEEDFIKAVRYGQAPNGRLLRQPMQTYGNLTPDEVKAVYAYLKTIPKIRNKVEQK